MEAKDFVLCLSCIERDSKTQVSLCSGCYDHSSDCTFDPGRSDPSRKRPGRLLELVVNIERRDRRLLLPETTGRLHQLYSLVLCSEGPGE